MPLLRLSPPTLLIPCIILTLSMSVLMLLSSTNWLTTWCFFELNMMFFILLLTFDTSKTKSVAMTTYFLAQALGSSLLLLGSLTFSNMANPAHQYFSLLIMTLAVLIKTAFAPFQQWFITMMPHISWLSILILSTLQKITPLLLLTNILLITDKTLTLTFIFILLNLFIGALGMLNSSNMKLLLAFSSLHHLGWIISSMSANSPQSTHMYITLYISTLIPLLLMLNSMTTLSPTSMTSLHTPNQAYPWILILLLLNLAGLPPMPLFFMKLLLLTQISAMAPTLVIALLITTAISSFSYLRFAMTFVLIPQRPSLQNL